KPFLPTTSVPTPYSAATLIAICTISGCSADNSPPTQTVALLFGLFEYPRFAAMNLIQSCALGFGFRTILRSRSSSRKGIGVVRGPRWPCRHCFRGFLRASEATVLLSLEVVVVRVRGIKDAVRTSDG